MNNNIVILGTTGFVGKMLTNKAIQRGYKVKTIARNPDKLGDLQHKIEVVKGDYFDISTLHSVLRDATAVLSTVGPPMTKKISEFEIKKYQSSIDYIVKTLPKGSRFINISGAGMKGQFEKLPFMRKLMRLMIGVSNSSVKKVKEYEIQAIENSTLNWTNIKPPMIKEKVEGRFLTNETKFLGMSVDVEQLCDFMLNNLIEDDWIKKSVIVATKK
ncbi:NAD(P)H-binding protein [Riemerella anatipestifer]|uniref:NAD(P)H-binding protein n=1 Tax=Riemerella anatipestifer TaxID=34085 RepID=UPI0030BAB318